MRAARIIDSFPGYLVNELGRSPITAEDYVFGVRCASRFLGKEPHKITTSDIRLFLREAPYALATKRGVVVGWRSYRKFGAVEGAWRLNGELGLQTPKVPKERRAPLDQTDAHRLLMHSVSSVQARVAYLGLYAGLRIKEIAGIREEHWLDGWLIVSPEIAKAQKKRTVPVHPELEKHRDLILRSSPTKGTCGVMFSRLSRKLDLFDIEGKQATPHTLRRTCATAMYRDGNGAKWEVVKKVLGHEEDVTAIYTWIGDGLMQEAVESIHFSDGKPVQLAFEW